jgi:hypothetical protein
MDGQPEPTKPAGELYYEAQMQTLENLFNECRDHDTDPFEWLLCIDTMTEPQVHHYEDEETGEELTYEDGEIITGHKFMLTFGGPSAWIQSTNDGRTLEYHYCDWFGSDYFKTGLTGKQEEEFNALFGIVFECHTEAEKVGAVVQ